MEELRQRIVLQKITSVWDGLDFGVRGDLFIYFFLFFHQTICLILLHFRVRLCIFLAVCARIFCPFSFPGKSISSTAITFYVVISLHCEGKTSQLLFFSVIGIKINITSGLQPQKGWAYGILHVLYLPLNTRLQKSSIERYNDVAWSYRNHIMIGH